MIAPYWTSKDGRHVLYNADCMDVLPTLVGVDAVVTDPPYGLNIEYESYCDTRESLRTLAPAFIAAATSIAKRTVCTPGVANLWLYPEPLWTACWAISGAGARGKWGFNCWQPILCYGQDPYLKAGLGARPDLLFVNEISEKNGHPCPKPLGFMERLIERATLELESVCDPFTGSGTTGVACIRTGRKFIGIEISREYCDIAVKRMERELSQPKLPGMEPERITQMSLLEAV